MKNKIKFYLIGSLILFCCCNGPEVEIINLSTQNGPFKIIGNQDSITAKYNKKLFTGTAIENFGNKQPKLIAEFRHGVLHGKLRKYNSDGKLILFKNLYFCVICPYLKYNLMFQINFLILNHIFLIYYLFLFQY